MDGGRMPLPTRPQRYRDPASLVFLLRWKGRLKSRSFWLTQRFDYLRRDDDFQTKTKNNVCLHFVDMKNVWVSYSRGGDNLVSCPSFVNPVGEG